MADRRQQFSHIGIHLEQCLLERRDRTQVQCQQPPVLWGDVPVQRLDQRSALPASGALRQIGQALGVALPGDGCPADHPAAAPGHIREHAAKLQVGVFRRPLDPQAVLRDLSYQLLAPALSKLRCAAGLGWSTVSPGGADSMVSNLWPGVLLANALQAMAPLAYADEVTKLTLPAHTEVQLGLQEPVTSATATQGQHFRLVVAADVLQEGRVLIPQGTPASGTVLAAERSGQMGAGGTLSVKLDYVQLGTQRVRLHWTFDSTDRSQENKARALSAIVLPLGFVAAGKDIEIPAGTLIRAHTKDSVDIIQARPEASTVAGPTPAVDPR